MTNRGMGALFIEKRFYLTESLGLLVRSAAPQSSYEPSGGESFGLVLPETLPFLA